MDPFTPINLGPAELANRLVMAVGTKPVNDLIKPLEERDIKVKVIGDAKKPGQIYDAVKDGFDIAIKI